LRKKKEERSKQKLQKSRKKTSPLAAEPSSDTEVEAVDDDKTEDI